VPFDRATLAEHTVLIRHLAHTLELLLRRAFSARIPHQESTAASGLEGGGSGYLYFVTLGRPFAAHSSG
jgi:hypothetical protein